MGIASIIVRTEGLADAEHGLTAIADRCGLPETGRRLAAQLHPGPRPPADPGRNALRVVPGGTAGGGRPISWWPGRGPLTISSYPPGGGERLCRLPGALSSGGARRGADPRAGRDPGDPRGLAIPRGHPAADDRLAGSASAPGGEPGAGLRPRRGLRGGPRAPPAAALPADGTDPRRRIHHRRIHHRCEGSPVSGPPLLAARGLTWRAGTRTILGPLDLDVFAGECLMVVGPNGAGKTTLLRLSTGLLPPAGGEILYRGRPLPSLPRRERARHIAYVPQVRPASVPLTVFEVVLLGAILTSRRSSWAADGGLRCRRGGARGRRDRRSPRAAFRPAVGGRAAGGLHRRRPGAGGRAPGARRAHDPPRRPSPAGGGGAPL